MENFETYKLTSIENVRIFPSSNFLVCLIPNPEPCAKSMKVTWG